MRMSFNCALQFLFFFHFDFSSKVTLLLNMCVLLFFTLYTFVFYILVFLFSKRNSAETLLAHSHYHQHSFFFESFCFLFRSWFRGFIQGVLFQSYEHEIISLTVSDIFFCTLVVLFRNSFSSRPLFVAILLYNSMFLFFDCVLSVRFLKPELLSFVNCNMIVLVSIWAIVAAFILQILVVIVISIYERFCMKKKKRRISQYEITTDCLEQLKKK